MKRAVRLSLKFITASKMDCIAALLRRYRSEVNFYIDYFWNGGDRKESYRTHSETILSGRYRTAAANQAWDIVQSTRKSCAATGKTATIPQFKGGAILDAKFITIEQGRRSFDIAIKISTLTPRDRLTVLTRATEVLRKWLRIPGAELVHGCCLREDRVIVWVDIPDLPDKTYGEVIGVDIGLNKLVSVSDGDHHGTEFKKIRDRIRRCKPKSKAKYRAFRQRDNYINRSVNKLPWKKLRVVGVEKLVGLKHGKKKNRGKNFRKAIAPWTYRHVLNRIVCKSQENRVLLVEVDAANTSRTCPVCGSCDRDNRSGENFACLSCGHTADADTVGACNVLARTLETLGSMDSPRHKKISV